MTDALRGKVYAINAKLLDTQIAKYEAAWPEFPVIYDKPTCCPGCMVPYDRWGFDQVIDWEKYYALRWLRGDMVAWEDDND